MTRRRSEHDRNMSNLRDGVCSSGIRKIAIIMVKDPHTERTDASNVVTKNDIVNASLSENRQLIVVFIPYIFEHVSDLFHPGYVPSL